MIVFFFQMPKFKCQAKFIDVKMREIEIGSSNVNKVHKLICTSTVVKCQFQSTALRITSNCWFCREIGKE